MAHRFRADAYAAELIVAATLLSWPSTSLPGPDGRTVTIGGGETRADFGVKITCDVSRRTADADVLTTDDSGVRAAVDVKHAASGVSRHRPAAEMLSVVAQAIVRSEIASFHFVSTGRFRPAVRESVASEPKVWVHDRVWPNAEQRLSIAARQPQAINYAQLIRETPKTDVDALFASQVRAAVQAVRTFLVPLVPFEASFEWDVALSAPNHAAGGRLVEVSAIAASTASSLTTVPLPESGLPTAWRAVKQAATSYTAESAARHETAGPALHQHVLAQPWPLVELLKRNVPTPVFSRVVLDGVRAKPVEVESVVSAPVGALLFWTRLS